MAGPPLVGVLLDIDGTLVDSNDAHAAAWVEALARKGIVVPFAKVRPLIGMGSDKLLPAAAGIDADSEEGRELADLHTRIFHAEHLPLLEPFPKARDLLLALDRKGLRLAAASSADAIELEGLLKAADVDDLLKASASSDHASESKPAPDILCASLEAIGAKPDEAVMIGDTPYDEEAAKAAGVPFIGFECGGWKRTDFRSAEAVYCGAADLLAHLARSPIAKMLG